jgi:hypothetical protein
MDERKNTKDGESLRERPSEPKRRRPSEYGVGKENSTPPQDAEDSPAYKPD